MKRILGMVAMAVLLVACTACDDGNLIKDPALRACVESRFAEWSDTGKKYDVNSKEDLAQITIWFYCESKGVKSLEGIEYLVNVTELRLGSNEIEDLSPLAGHPKLEVLNIDSNQIRNIDSLNNMNKLYRITMMGNYIQDIMPLEKLTALTYVALIDNCIVDLIQCEELKQTFPGISLNGCSATDQHPEKCQ